MRKIIFFLFIVLFFACKKSEKIDLNTDYSYYPIEIGNWVIYNVQEINIDKPSEVYDTLNYQLKEVIESEFLDAEEKIAYRVERYIRINQTDSWTLKNVWFTNYTLNAAHKIEDNTRYVKLIFPVKLNKKWNGNAFNNLGEQDYKITFLDISETINNLSFDSVLTVEQYNSESLIDKRIEIEKFAKNIGLIYKEQTDLYSDNVIIGVPIEQRVKTGKILKMEIIDHGKN